MEFHQIIVGSTCPGYNLKLFSWLEISKHKLNEPILRLGPEQPSNGVLITTSQVYISQVSKVMLGLG